MSNRVKYPLKAGVPAGAGLGSPSCAIADRDPQKRQDSSGGIEFRGSRSALLPCLSCGFGCSWSQVAGEIRASVVVLSEEHQHGASKQSQAVLAVREMEHLEGIAFGLWGIKKSSRVVMLSRQERAYAVRCAAVSCGW